MLLTRNACYALIAVKHLAGNPGEDTSCSAKDLATRYDLPEKSLAKTLQHLAKSGLLHSQHGSVGGYRLARNPRQVTVLEIIRASEDVPKSNCQVSVPRQDDPLWIVRQVLEVALAELTIVNL
jgi:Rrf2 family protein